MTSTYHRLTRNQKAVKEDISQQRYAGSCLHTLGNHMWLTYCVHYISDKAKAIKSCIITLHHNNCNSGEFLVFNRHQSHDRE